MKTSLKYVGVLATLILAGCGNGEEVSTESTTAPTWDQTIDVDGIVEAPQEEEIYLAFPAKVVDVPVKEGEIVSKGQPLFKLDTTDYNEVIRDKKGEMAVLEAQLDALKKNADPLVADLQNVEDQLSVKEGYQKNGSDPEIKGLQSNMDKLDQELKILQSDYKSNKALYDAGSLSQRELQKISDDIALKEKEQKGVAAQIETIEANTSSAISELAAKKQSLQLQMNESDYENAANMKVIQVQLKNAKAELASLEQKYSTVSLTEGQLVAKADQILIYDIQCVAGSQIAANSSLLARCADLSSMMVTIDVPVEELLRVKIGDKVTIDAYNEQTQNIEGKIERLSNHAIDKDGDSYIEADVSITEGKQLLKAGAQVDGTIYLSE